jgi:hypothetical protein
VHSEEKSVEKAKARLLRMGFTEDQIAIHTAEEPDSDLLALANEEHREVLIFKMAVALGFDAPRAFTLVSMRASRDAEFGVQLVGRILRVHRLLQGRAQAKTLPDELNYGYVFLAAAETQTGLDIAGQKINAIQTEYAKASTATVALRFGEGLTGVSKIDESGQIEFFGLETEETGGGGLREDPPAPTTPEFVPPTSFDFGKFFGSSEAPDDGNAPHKAPKAVAGQPKLNRYPIRPDVPRRFKSQEPADNEITEEDCAKHFIISTRDLLEAMMKKVPVEKRTLDVFAQTIQQEFNFEAELSAEEAAKLANKVLCKDGTMDPRELRRVLRARLADEMQNLGMVTEAADPARVLHLLNVILATHPELLQDAVKKAVATHMEIQEAEELPPEVESAEPLQKSPRNLYSIMPGGMNGWERDFAEILDHDPHMLVKWWHRNPPDKPWSVNVLLPNGRGFYPDFIIGIEGRNTEDSALLADPKDRFETSKEVPKVLAIHQTYGRVMILAKDGVRWMTIGYDEKARKPVMAREFRIPEAADF